MSTSACLGCKRPRGALLRDSLIQTPIHKLARQRWQRVRTLAHRISYAADAFKKLLVHVRYMPGGTYEKAIRANWNEACKRQRDYDIDVDLVDGRNVR